VAVEAEFAWIIENAGSGEGDVERLPYKPQHIPKW